MMATASHTIPFAELKNLPEGRLPVMEHFYTVQGEGAYTGQAAYFIRLAGCDVGCVWCDVKESWGVSSEQLMNHDTLVDQAAESPSELVVITGGEPLLHDLTALTCALQENGLRVHLETSGAHPLSGRLDWVCLSPKKFKFPLPEVYTRADELKVIVYNKKDFDWAEEQAAKVGRNCRLFLQPEWSKREVAMDWIVQYVKQNPQWQISLQTHNYLQVP